ncbi:O-fucosyltransferase family protein [Paenibacillus durus]|uniref:TPR repeat-containing protein n=1 Tax=Paenibacillus durus TaxID=44251 RepID=A0A089HTT3_PAEDU|nr:O-fucosyltransferase family protein [Paenibacillus durus]AIQ14170.1 TPR repeat-containing protein [Paenibacillus durus]
MSINRFLLIKPWGYSIWADVDHVVGQLLIAEITDRTPIVYWGMDSLYSESVTKNSFELFFEPINEHMPHEAVRSDFTYYPPIWTSHTVLMEDPDKLKWEDRDLQDMIATDANVLVSDVYYHVGAIAPWIPDRHPLFGKTPHQIYRYLFDKYIKIQPSILDEAKQFVYENPQFRDEKPILGVHIRANGLVSEIGQIYNINDYYHPNIWSFMSNFECRHLFLITDHYKFVRQFQKIYDKYETLIVSESRKAFFRGRIHPNRSNYPNQRHKGIELIKDTSDIIKDTYLAVQCDYFIGNGYSSLSNTVLRMKDWPEKNIKLLY